jgi:hypothetical protein
MSNRKKAQQKFVPKSAASSGTPLIFGKKNYLWLGIGLGFIVLGMLLMLGGGMPDANTWDDSLIYSHRRITLAPLSILIGLGIQIYAIFLKNDKSDE